MASPLNPLSSREGGIGERWRKVGKKELIITTKPIAIGLTNSLIASPWSLS